MQEVKDYLDYKRWYYKQVPSKRGIQFLVDHCPLCHSNDATHFYIAEASGMFYCHKCGAKGTLLTLKEKLGDLGTTSTFKDIDKTSVPEKPVVTEEQVANAQAALDESREGLKFLKHRGFSGKAINHFRLGYAEEDGQKWIWIPYIANGKPVNVKKRAIESKMFGRIPGGPSILLNQDVLKESPEEIIITEGEMDCIAVWGAGFHNVVGSTIGAKGINPEWIDLLDTVGKIYIAYDMDDAGKEGAQELAERLGIERCYKVNLPVGVKDCNEFFQKGYSSDAFSMVLEQAKPFNIKCITTIGEELENYLRYVTANEGDMREGFHVPWPKLDKMINGLGAGDLVAVAGLPGVGKSTFCINLAYLYSFRQEVPILLFELEMRPQRIMPGVIALHSGIDRQNANQVDVIQATSRELAKKPWSFVYKYNKPDYAWCADTIKKWRSRNGAGVVLFDNLHFLIRDAKNQTGEVSVTVQKFKLLAEELSIPIILIARPRKLFGSKLRMTNQDLKDCVTGGTQISIDSGEFRSAKSLVGKKTEQYNIISFDTENNKVIEAKTKEVWPAGLKKCYRIRTKLGYMVELSENSKVWNGEDWVLVSSIKVGDQVGVDVSVKPTRKGVQFNSGKTHFPKEHRPNPNRRTPGYDHGKVKRKIMKSDFNQKMRMVNPPIGTKLTNNGYILIYQPDWPSALKRENHLKGYIYEHIYLIEKHLDRQLLKDEVVHHLDGNKTNNNIDNLLVCTNTEHKLLHWKENQLVHKLIREGKVYYDRDSKEFIFR